MNQELRKDIFATLAMFTVIMIGVWFVVLVTS